MEENKKPIERVVKLTLSLQEAWKALGYPKVESEYLDADAHDDVDHGGYGARDASTFDVWLDERFAGAHLLFPMSVARAMEDAERQAMADLIGEDRRDTLERAYEKISVAGEYEGAGAHGEPVQVSVAAKITDATVDTPGCAVTITIENPEHLLNDVINGVGHFYPTEIVATEELSEASLKSYFLANIGDFFEVYGERRPEPGRGRMDPFVKDENFIDILRSDIDDLLTDDDLADGVVEAVEDGKVADMTQAVAMAARITGRPADEIRTLVRKAVEGRKSATSAVYKKMLRELAV